MENEKRLFNILLAITLSSLIFNIFIFITGLTFGIINDEILSRIYDSSSQVSSSMNLPSWVMTLIENTGNKFSLLIGMLDYLFLLGFVIFAGSSLFYSYRMKQENIFSILSILTIGLMFLFYLGNIILSVSDVFKNLLLGILPILSTKLPYFTYYVTHLGIINLILFGGCIIANILDLKFTKPTEKDQELNNLSNE